MNVYSMVLVTILLYTSSVVDGYGDGNRVLLKDIQAITLNLGLYTNGRRNAGVPQLKCVGGSAGCNAWSPSTVQCYNRGSDGYDIQWECKSEMPTNYKFGAISVSCEGFDYPDDPYILKGSCGLEYKLELASTRSSSDYYQKPKDYGDANSKSSMGSLLFLVACIVIVYAIYYTCIKSDTGGGDTPGSGYRNTQAPPPPGFRSDYYPSSNTGTGFGNDCGSSSTYTRNPNTGTGGGGFWTGAATGGLFGYMMGTNSNRNQNAGTNQSYGFREPTSSGSSSTYTSGSTSTSTPSSSTQTSSGFGSTKRR